MLSHLNKIYDVCTAHIHHIKNKEGERKKRKSKKKKKKKKKSKKTRRYILRSPPESAGVRLKSAKTSADLKQTRDESGRTQLKVRLKSVFFFLADSGGLQSMKI